MNYDHLIELITLIGTELYGCGAEVHRVEDSLSRLLSHFGAESYHVFVITSQITVSAKFEGRNYTIMRRCKGSSVDFNMLGRWNNLCRSLCQKTVTDSEVQVLFDDVRKTKPTPWYVPFIGTVISAPMFSLFFGGDYLDALAAAVLGLVIFSGNLFLRKRINGFFYMLILTFITGSLGVAFSDIGFGHHVDKILIGTVMLVIPGMVVTNSLRDIFLGDTISGSLKGIESMILIACIATGYGLSLLAFAGNTPQTPSEDVPWWLQLVSGFIGTMSLALMFNATPRMMLVSVIGIGMIMGMSLGIGNHLSLLLASFLMALAAGVYGEIAARVVKTPAIGLITIALVPLYPGGSLYYSFAYLVQGNQEMFIRSLQNSGWILLGLSFGIVVSTVVYHYLTLGIGYLIKTFRRLREIPKHD